MTIQRSDQVVGDKQLSADMIASILRQPAIVPYSKTLAFAVLLGYHGKRSGSLALDGAIAASLLGYMTLANPLKVFGVSLLVFYLSGSRATKVKAAYKASLEEEPSHEGTKGSKPGGNRSAYQVACNALFGCICAVIWRLLYSGELADGKIWKGRLWIGEKAMRWCVVDARWGWSRGLVLGAVGFWGACAGDTFASELGMLARSQPRLVTTFRKVPPGTNGGITVWGTFVSLLGGLLVGIAAAISLYIENTECRTTNTIISGAEVNSLIEVVAVGGISGLVGSFIDSILGATLQETLFSSTRKKVVPNRVKKVDGDKIERIAGRAILSNNAVNIFASSAMGGLVIWYARTT